MLKNKIVGAALGVGMVLATVAPSFAANTSRVHLTGAKSFNLAGNLNLRRTVVNNPQTANVTNNVTTNTNTGNNETDKNTLVEGPVETGDAEAKAKVNTYANDSLITVNGCGCPDDNEAEIDTTGYKSTNIAFNINASDIEVNNEQSAKVVNNVTTRSNTGRNSTSKNTQVGGVGTGNATSNVTVNNTVNVSTITIN